MTNDVGPAPDQAGYHLVGTEVWGWGGNNVADKLVKLPGLVGLIQSRPVEPATSVPVAALESVDRVLPDLKEPQMFATLALLRFDDSSEAEYVLAGHPPILLN